MGLISCTFIYFAQVALLNEQARNREAELRLEAELQRSMRSAQQLDSSRHSAAAGGAGNKVDVHEAL